MLDELAVVRQWDLEIEALLDETRAAAASEVVVTLPTSISATTLMRVQDDPEGLARHLARPMPRKPSRAARFGTRFHAWVETHVGEPLLLDPDDLPGRADLDIAGDADLRELIEAFRAGPGFGIYSAMKAAVENLTKTLALELADQRIRVNTIAPDVIPTPGDAGLVDTSGASSENEHGFTQPWPDSGSTWDCAGAALFLASDLSRFVTGSTIHVDGGTHAASGWRRSEDGSRWVL